MSLFDRLTGAFTQPPPKPAAPEAPKPEAPKIFTVDRSKMFDLKETSTLSELFAVPREKRTAAWQGAFFTAFWNASLELGTPTVFRGPDQFFYLRLQIPAPGKPFNSNSAANLAQQVLGNGSGIAIFASPEATEPEYVLSMGMIDSLLTYDSWLGDPLDLQPAPDAEPNVSLAEGLQTITTSKEQKIFLGSPAASFLPAHTARALYNYLTMSWLLPNPGIALMYTPFTSPARNLVVGKKLSEFPSAEAAGLQGRMLLWYLPPKRGLILMPESWNGSELKPLTGFFKP